MLFCLKAEKFMPRWGIGGKESGILNICQKLTAKRVQYTVDSYYYLATVAS
jgi:hypothetical protein